jgi:hypothetical protein
MIQLMNSNDKGNIGYAMVIADVMKKGYFVFTPIADTTSVDMVIGNNKMELKRVQVKYRTKTNKGVLEIPIHTVVNGKKVQVDVSKVDLWAIYCPDTDTVYYVPTEIVKGKTSIYLRIDEPVKKNNKMHFARDYVELEF